MRVIYNGVAMDLTRTEQFVGEPVMDNIAGTDYLMTKHQIAFSAVVGEHLVDVVADPKLVAGAAALDDVDSPADRSRNRVGIGYEFSGAQIRVPPSEFNSLPPGLPPEDRPEIPADLPNVGFGTIPKVASSPSRGVLPGQFGIAAPPVDTRTLYRIVPADVPATVTMAAIRHRLTTPRGQLWVFNGTGAAGEVLVSAPEPGCRCDPKGGPFPRLLGIDTALGDGRMFVVHFGVELYLIESEQNGVSLADPRSLLSNTFTQKHTIDKDSYLTITTEGEAVFRADYVYKNRENPDAFRPRFFLPVPLGFQRENIEVDAIPGAMGVRYGYQDRQTPALFPAGRYVRAASISIQHRQAIVTDGDVLEGALSVYERVQSNLLSRKWLNQQDQPRGKGRRRRRPPPNGGQLPTPP